MTVFEDPRTRGRPKKPPFKPTEGQRGVKTPYTAEWYAAINSWNESPRDAIPRNNNDKKTERSILKRATGGG